MIASIEARNVAGFIVTLALGLVIIVRAKWIEAEARPTLERIPVLRIIFVPMYSVVGLRVFGLSFIAMAFFVLLA